MDAQNKKPDKPSIESANAPSIAEEYPELGIKRVRTFAEDLALAKEKAGVKEEVPKKKKGSLFGSKKKKKGKPNPKKDLSKIQPEVDMSKAPPAEEKVPETTKPSREYIEQELARSGIVTDKSIEKKDDKKNVKDESSVSAIRTYKYDAAESIEEKGTSQIEMLAAEQKRRVKNKDFSRSVPGGQSVKMNIALVVLSFVLIVLGVWGGVHFYNKSKILGEPVVVVSKTTLFTDNRIEIDSHNNDGTRFSSLLLNSANDVSGRLNALTELVFLDRGLFGENKISKDNLFKKLESNAPARLIRNLQDDYVVGVHSGESTSLFYLFKIDDFDTVFAGVLEWESFMHSDLYGSGEGGLFEDIFLQNKDTRIQKDSFGNIKLIYSFPNSDTLLITKNEEAFFEIFERLTVSNATQN